MTNDQIRDWVSWYDSQDSEMRDKTTSGVVYEAARHAWLSQESRIAALKAEVERLTRERDDEKRRRVYYQDIVYAVCNKIDRLIAGTVQCGTVDSPSVEVQERLDELLFGGTRLSRQPAAVVLTDELVERCAYKAFLSIKGLDERFFAHAPKATRVMWRNAARAVLAEAAKPSGNSPSIPESSQAEGVSDEELGRIEYEAEWKARGDRKPEWAWSECRMKYAYIAGAKAVRDVVAAPLRAALAEKDVEIRRLRGAILGAKSELEDTSASG